MFGFFNIHKPLGYTSRDVVNRIGHHLAKVTGERKIKCGHAGTLDPLAEGVLVLAVGPATRLIQYVQRAPKTYIATFQLGVTSDSDDTETELKAIKNTPIPTLREIEQTLPLFLGKIEQIPPTYSAVKLGGKRAYDLARQGKQVTTKAREVEIHTLKILAYDYPQLKLQVVCGSGTYIRSLGRDLAQHLETGGVMTALTRSAIGDFFLEQAHTVDQVLATKDLKSLIDPAQAALKQLPQIVLNQQQKQQLVSGRPIDFPAPLTDTKEFVAIDAQQNLLAIMHKASESVLKPAINFVPAQREAN